VDNRFVVSYNRDLLVKFDRAGQLSICSSIFTAMLIMYVAY
jgi:hypothetical protein